MIYYNGEKLIGKVIITDEDGNETVVNGLNAKYHETVETELPPNTGDWNDGW